MNDQMLRFLKVLAAYAGPVRTRDIGIRCCVHQGQARQDARRLGYAIFQNERWSWTITPVGRDALTAAPNGRR